MFNVFALLLNDASHLVFSCFSEDTDISQDSVATHLRCCGKDSTITIFLLILQ